MKKKVFEVIEISSFLNLYKKKNHRPSDDDL